MTNAQIKKWLKENNITTYTVVYDRTVIVANDAIDITLGRALRGYGLKGADAKAALEAMKTENGWTAKDGFVFKA